MIGALRQVKVFAYCAPADMRKGFGGLSGLVREEMTCPPEDGSLYLFTNRTRTRAKVLYFDGTGLCLFAKRLERGRFTKLWELGAAGRALELTKAELDLFLDGSRFVGVIPTRTEKLERKDMLSANWRKRSRRSRTRARQN